MLMKQNVRYCVGLRLRKPPRNIPKHNPGFVVHDDHVLCTAAFEGLLSSDRCNTTAGMAVSIWIHYLIRYVLDRYLQLCSSYDCVLTASPSFFFFFFRNTTCEYVKSFRGVTAGLCTGWSYTLKRRTISPSVIHHTEVVRNISSSVIIPHNILHSTHRRAWI